MARLRFTFEDSSTYTTPPISASRAETALHMLYVNVYEKNKNRLKKFDGDPQDLEPPVCGIPANKLAKLPCLKPLTGALVANPPAYGLKTQNEIRLQLEEDGESRFILVQPKLQIKERKEEDKYSFNVWGATPDDIEFFKGIWGEPARTEAQRLSPVEFAQELIGIPGIMNKSKEEIMDLMELDERKYTQYQRLIQNQLRRPNAAEVFVKAAEILNK